MSYRAAVQEAIAGACRDRARPPVLFVGAGASRRYLGLPSWGELLQGVLDRIGHERPLAFYQQRCGDLIAAASEIADLVHAWAWGEGRGSFPAGLFGPEQPRAIFLKHLVAAAIRQATPTDLGGVAPELAPEVAALERLPLHLALTTNYDRLLEMLYGFEAQVHLDGVLHDPRAGGRVLKVHGCVEAPETIVLLAEDFEGYGYRHRYLFANLLVHFAEHPVLFLGYGLGDPDIAGLLVDAARGLQRESLENVFVLDWADEPPGDTPLGSHHLRSPDGAVGIRAVSTREFGWVYEAFAAAC